MTILSRVRGGLFRGRNSAVTMSVEHTSRDHVFVFDPPLSRPAAETVGALVARIPGIERMWWFRDASHLIVGHRADARVALLRRAVRMAVRAATHAEVRVAS